MIDTSNTFKCFSSPLANFPPQLILGYFLFALCHPCNIPPIHSIHPLIYCVMNFDFYLGRILVGKLDGVGFVENSPSTKKFHHSVQRRKKKRKKNGDTWHVTHEMWHLTHNLWHMTLGGGEPSVQISAPELLWFGSEGVLKIFSQKMTYLMKFELKYSIWGTIWWIQCLCDKWHVSPWFGGNVAVGTGAVW